MKVLVTGGTGFLGRQVVQRLLHAGDTVRVLVRPSSAERAAKFMMNSNNQAGLDLITGDLRDMSSLVRGVNGMDAVCHCAAHVQASGNWSDFEEVTVQGTERLLLAASGEGIKRFLHVSSLGVCGADEKNTVTEESPLDSNPSLRGYYTRSKIEAEKLVWKHHRERQLPVTVIRPGVLYGPGRPPFVARRCVSIGHQIRIAFGRPQQLLPLVFVDNVADAIYLALRTEGAVGRAYNVVEEAIFQGEYLGLLKRAALTKSFTMLVSPTPFYPLISLLEIFCRAVGKSSPVSRHQVEHAFASIRYDTSRAGDELGWTPRIGLTEALSKMREVYE